jgi:hypothetical protein
MIAGSLNRLAWLRAPGHGDRGFRLKAWLKEQGETRSPMSSARHCLTFGPWASTRDIGSDFHRNKPSLNLLPQCFFVTGEVVMWHHVRPPQYAWGYDWPDDCPPPCCGRVTFTYPPAHARVAVQLPPCKPHAGINTDWSGNKCAMLHKSSSYALLPAPPAQSQASQPAPSAQPQASQPAPPRLRSLVRTRSP